MKLICDCLFVFLFLFLFKMCSIVYIPAGDAAIYRQTTLMTLQLAQDMDSNASVVKPTSSSFTTTTMTR